MPTTTRLFQCKTDPSLTLTSAQHGFKVLLVTALVCCLQIRKVMNALDNERESRATDVLLNYETVKYFCNEAFELAGYDKATRRYQVC